VSIKFCALCFQLMNHAQIIDAVLGLIYLHENSVIHGDLKAVSSAMVTRACRLTVL
jgi:serine/threonine protein kinase